MPSRATRHQTHPAIDATQADGAMTAAQSPVPASPGEIRPSVIGSTRHTAHIAGTLAAAVALLACALSVPDHADAKSQPKSSGSSSQVSILALVNDEPVTAYEVEQRARLNALSHNIGPKAQAAFQSIIKQDSTTKQLKAILQRTIQENQGKTREQIIAIFERRKADFAKSLQRQALDNARAGVLPKLRKDALDEIIDEKLKLQEAKRTNSLADDKAVDNVINSIAQRNKMTSEQFATHLKGQGVAISSMRQRFKTTLSWNEVVRRKFGRQVEISQRDVDQFVAKAPGAEDGVELQLQRITFGGGQKLGQKELAASLATAERLRAQFRGCASAPKLVKDAPGARLDNLGERRPDTIPEPTRSLLLNAKAGEMLPATVGPSGVELWMMCGRKVVKGSEQVAEKAKDELRQREFELLARRHLQDLRQDATIDRRQ
jgi:peptidyl-prolyl cis-trans isomerase SurA